MRIRSYVPDGLRLVGAVCLSALLLIGFLTWRAYENIHAQQGLCEKIDRFMVLSEAAVQTNDTLTPQEKAQRLRFYEDFRNDPPVCRPN